MDLNHEKIDICMRDTLVTGTPADSFSSTPDQLDAYFFPVLFEYDRETAAYEGWILGVT